MRDIFLFFLRSHLLFFYIIINEGMEASDNFINNYELMKGRNSPALIGDSIHCLTVTKVVDVALWHLGPPINCSTMTATLHKWMHGMMTPWKRLIYSVYSLLAVTRVSVMTVVCCQHYTYNKMKKKRRKFITISLVYQFS